jgi:hypothetical protein
VSANGVRALPGGGMAATSFMDTDDPDACKKVVAGQPTGGVLIWHPRRGWQKVSIVAGISAPNGVLNRLRTDVSCSSPVMATRR